MNGGVEAMRFNVHLSAEVCFPSGGCVVTAPIMRSVILPFTPYNHLRLEFRDWSCRLTDVRFAIEGADGMAGGFFRATAEIMVRPSSGAEDVGESRISNFESFEGARSWCIANGWTLGIVGAEAGE